MTNPGGAACGCANPVGAKVAAPGLKLKLLALGFRPPALGCALECSAGLARDELSS